MMMENLNCVDRFLLTRLLRGVTERKSMKLNQRMISTHTPLARRDRKSRKAAARPRFLLTRLLRGVTANVLFMGCPCDFYSHASCEA